MGLAEIADAIREKLIEHRISRGAENRSLLIAGTLSELARAVASGGHPGPLGVCLRSRGREHGNAPTHGPRTVATLCDREQTPGGTARAGKTRRILILELRVVVSLSSGSVMRFIQEDSRHYPMFRHRSATPAGVTGNGVVRSLGDNVASIQRSAGNA